MVVAWRFPASSATLPGRARPYGRPGRTRFKPSWRSVRQGGFAIDVCSGLSANRLGRPHGRPYATVCRWGDGVLGRRRRRVFSRPAERWPRIGDLLWPPPDRSGPLDRSLCGSWVWCPIRGSEGTAPAVFRHPSLAYPGVSRIATTKTASDQGFQLIKGHTQRHAPQLSVISYQFPVLSYVSSTHDA